MKDLIQPTVFKKKHNLILRLLDKLSEIQDAKRKEKNDVSRRQG